MTPSGLAPHDSALPPRGDEHGGRSEGSSADEPGTPHAHDVPHQPAGHPLHTTYRRQHPVHTAGPVPDASVLTLDDPGPLLATGGRADVFALDEDYVLRRYRDGDDATREAVILQHVAAHGFPAPAVFLAHGPNLVMERLHGPTLLQALAAGEIAIPDAAQVLVDLHARLHTVPAAPDAPQDEAQWPHIAAGPVVVHLDLHPGNVVLTETRGPALVDWANARAGTPELDAALSALILAEVAVDAGGVYSQAARALLAAFVVRDDVPVTAALDTAAQVRRSDPALVSGEKELVGAATELVRELVRVSS